MKTSFLKHVLVAVLTVTLPLSSLVSCGGSSGSSSSSSSEVPEDFNELTEATNTQASVINTDLSTLVDAWETAVNTGASSTATLAEVNTALDDVIAAGEDFVDEFDHYGDLVDAYSSDLSSLTKAGVSGQLLGPVIKKQSADPRTVLAVSDAIKNAKNDKASCDTQFPEDQFPDENAACKKKALLGNLGETVRVGMGVTLAAGGAKLVGAACTAAAAPGLVAAGLTIGTGVLIYTTWNYCTKSSSKLVDGSTVMKEADDDESCSTCAAINSCASETTTLADGRVASVCTFSQGTGTLVIHPPEGTPIVLEDLTIGSDGVTIDISDCTGKASSATSAEAGACNTAVTTTSTAEVAGATCADISSITASTSPSDPSAGETVIVTYKVFPAVSGCPTSYSVSGTDSYSASGTPTTGSDGSATFSIPGGATGVVDTVILGETTNSNSRTITYTF